MDERAPLIFEEPAGEFPPRYWWMKRLAAACAIGLVLLAVLQLCWWRVANARLASAVADLRATNNPASIEDLDQGNLQDGENAAHFLTLAASKINPKLDCPSESNFTFIDYRFPYSPKWFGMEQAAATANQAAFADLREARRRTKAQWVRLISPLTNVGFTYLSQQRTLANNAADYAMLLHFHGNDAEALEVINDLLAQARAVDQQPIVVSHLVAGGLRALATTRVQLMAPELTIAGVSPTTNPSARPATRQQVEQLIKLLLDNSWRTRDSVRMFAAERVYQIDYIKTRSDDQFLLHPMLMLDAEHSAKSTNPGAITAPLPDWPAARAALTSQSPTTNPARIIGQVVNGTMNRAIETHFRIEEICNAAAVSLAVRLYRWDHAGALPPKLDALVPKYLATVPLDPMSPGARPMGYIILQNGQRAVVYSVGENGIDDTAAGVPVPSSPYYGWNTVIKDQYTELLRWNPPPSTQPGESEETSDN